VPAAFSAIPPVYHILRACSLAWLSLHTIRERLACLAVARGILCSRHMESAEGSMARTMKKKGMGAGCTILNT